MADYPIKFPCPVRRLQVLWRKGKWSVEGEIHIPSMTLSRSDDLPPVERVSGFWWEIVDEQGLAIYRQILPDPFTTGMEMFEKEGRISRTAHKMPDELSFDVLVPDLPQVAEVRFYSSSKPGQEHEGRGAAERVAALDIRKRKGGGRGRN